MSRRLLPLRALQALEAAARLHSFARAAEELHVTPAAISQQIKQLEDQLGRPLFLRGANLTATPAAADVLALLRDGFDLLDRASRQLRETDPARALVVSVAPSFASRWLIPRLGRFQNQHPDIELRLLATTRQVDFDREDVDVGVRYGGGNYPGLHVERLRSETLVAAAHPRIAATLQQPADLLQATLLHDTYMSWDASFPDWPAWLRNLGVTVDAPLKIREFGDANLVIEAALAGLGVALTWRTLLADEFAAGRLVPLFSERPLSSSYHFVCAPRSLARTDVLAFRDWLVDEIATDQA